MLNKKSSFFKPRRIVIAKIQGKLEIEKLKFANSQGA